VELGNWNLTPRGPHVTPSFYLGFNNEPAPIAVPWLQLNSLRINDSAAPQHRRSQGGSPGLHPLGEPLATGKRLRHEEAGSRPASRRADFSEYEADSQAGDLTRARKEWTSSSHHVQGDLTNWSNIEVLSADTTAGNRDLVILFFQFNRLWLRPARPGGLLWVIKLGPTTESATRVPLRAYDAR
jgi:hypothetical protein